MNKFKYDLLPNAGDGPLFSAARRLDAESGRIVDIVPVADKESDQLEQLLEAKNAADRALDEFLASLF